MYLVGICASFDMPRPTDEQGRPHTSFPGGELAAPERSDTTIRLGDGLSAIVGGEDHDDVVQRAHIPQLFQQVADVVVQLLHTGFVADADIPAQQHSRNWQQTQTLGNQ